MSRNRKPDPKTEKPATTPELPVEQPAAELTPPPPAPQKVRQIHCPQCGTLIDAGAKQCYQCQCWLVAPSAQGRAETQAEIRRRAEEDVEGKEPLSGRKIGDFWAEDVERFWNGFWGEKMPKRFAKIASGNKFVFSLSGMALPSVWLGFRKKWVMSVVVMLINYGIPLGIDAWSRTLPADSSLLEPAGWMVSIITVVFALLFGLILPHYFWKATQEDLENLGVKDRPNVEDRVVNKAVLEAGRPSFIGGIFAFMLLVMFTAFLAPAPPTF